jgi:hypothetical protein
MSLVPIRQGLRFSIGTEDTYTTPVEEYVRDNASSVTCSRLADQAFRAKYLGDNKSIGLYTDFTSILISEYNSVVTVYGQAYADALVAVDSLGNKIELVGTTAYLAKFWSTLWLDFRWVNLPDYATSNDLSGLDLDYIFMDLCNLYPIDNLTDGTGIPPELGTTPEEWRAAMLFSIGHVRTLLHDDIQLVVNCVRQHLGTPGYTTNPEDFEKYDGADAIVPGTYADAGVIEYEIDYNAPESNLWLWTLRSVYRVAAQDKVVFMTAKIDGSSDPITAIENERRMDNFVSWLLVRTDDYSAWKQTDTNAWSPNPVPVFPENNVQVGPAVAGIDGAVDTRFWVYGSTTDKLLVRKFENGYVALFFAESLLSLTVDVPVEYTLGDYNRLELTDDILINGFGATNATITTTPVLPGDVVKAGHGILLRTVNSVDVETVVRTRAYIALEDQEVTLTTSGVVEVQNADFTVTTSGVVEAQNTDFEVLTSGFVEEPAHSDTDKELLTSATVNVTDTDLDLASSGFVHIARNNSTSGDSHFGGTLQFFKGEILIDAENKRPLRVQSLQPNSLVVYDFSKNSFAPEADELFTVTKLEASASLIQNRWIRTNQIIT